MVSSSICDRAGQFTLAIVSASVLPLMVLSALESESLEESEEPEEDDGSLDEADGEAGGEGLRLRC